MKRIVESYTDFVNKLNESNINDVVNKIGEWFFEHYEQGKKFPLNTHTSFLKNKFPIINDGHEKIVIDDDLLFYSGVDKNRDILSVTSWSYDENTAEVFSDKYDDGLVLEVDYFDFIKYFDFISMDTIHSYLLDNNYNLNELNKYVSESEIIAYPKVNKLSSDDIDKFIQN